MLPMIHFACKLRRPKSATCRYTRRGFLECRDFQDNPSLLVYAFDGNRKMKEIDINVYHDERVISGNHWLHHGMLFVPSIHQDWLVGELVRLRETYDGFIHFVELRTPAAPTPQGQKTLVAKRWARFFHDDTRHSRRNARFNNFCTAVLGINLEKLNWEYFGSNADRNIFNRFFRTALLSGLRFFYSPDFDIVRVRHVYHGTRDLAQDNPLRWHPMWKIEQDSEGRILFDEPKLTLVNADHRKDPTSYEHSQLIQFIDLVLGAFSQCLDCTSSSRGCTEVARELQPVIERLTRRPNNKNSRYYAKYSESFFPSRKLNPQDLNAAEGNLSTFYFARKLKIVELQQSTLMFDPPSE